MKNNFAFILSTIIIASLLFSCKSNTPATEDAATAEVQTPVTVAPVTKDSMSEYIELNATATFLWKSYVKANANGYLQSADIRPGQYVSHNAVLFTVKTKEAESIGNTINSLDSSFRFSGTNSIRAGENGYITELNHQPGDYVQDGEQLAVISNTNSFVFLMNMPYELRPYIEGKRQVQLLLPDGEQLPGTISAAMPSVDSAAQTQKMVIKVNAPHPIPENLVAKVHIIKTFKPGAITVPKAAVLTDETQSEFWIMKLLDSTTAVKVPVKKGMENTDKVEILSPPLGERDQILVSGNYGLEDTAKVKIIQPQQ